MVMLIDRPIPSETFIEGGYVRFWYPSQPKTCRKCGAEDHLAAACNSQCCFNCERLGHRVEQCDRPALCRVCLSDAHETASCPFIFYGAVSSPKPGDQTYSEAAKTGSVAEAARQTQTSEAKLRGEERVRREAHARQEQEQKEKKKKEKERSERGQRAAGAEEEI